VAFKCSNNLIPLDEIVLEFIHLICDKLELTTSLINVNNSAKWVNSPNCGATSIFIGFYFFKFGFYFPRSTYY